MKKLAIIILKFNGEEKLKTCLNSLNLARIAGDWQKEIIIIDNTRNNLGFAAGVNQGIKKAQKLETDAVLLLNQDTQVERDFLSSLLSNPAGIVAPVIKFHRKGEYVYDFGGKINRWLGRSTHVEFNHRDCQAQSADYVSGCAMLIRRPVWEKIGLMDERFFLYFEDADYCLRAHRAGFKISVETKSLIEHYLEEGRKKPLFQRWHLWKSNLLFINRWLPFWQRPSAYIYWWLLGFKIFI